MFNLYNGSGKLLGTYKTMKGAKIAEGLYKSKLWDDLYQRQKTDPSAKLVSQITTGNFCGSY